MTGKDDLIMRKDDCIFCKIANGEIPSKTIYEDEDFRVFLDLAPATRGHALIVPKGHADDLFELEDKVAAKILTLAKQIGRRMSDNLGCDGMNLVQNNGEAAGQTVKHFHMHVIPRYTDDGQNIAWVPSEVEAEELEAVKNQIAE